MIERQIRERALMISADIKHGIRPASNESARRWLFLARAWAVKNGYSALAAMIEGSLGQ